MNSGPLDNPAGAELTGDAAAHFTSPGEGMTALQVVTSADVR